MQIEQQNSTAKTSSDEINFSSATINRSAFRRFASKLAMIPLVLVLMSNKEGSQAADSSLLAQLVTLAWDASPDSSVVGYRIYYGDQSGSYTNSIAVGNILSVSLRNLAPEVTYFFAATAYDASGAESPFSNEVGYKTKRGRLAGPQHLRIPPP